MLVGAGQMATEYAKVLLALKTHFITIGRGEESVKQFQIETSLKAEQGGIENWIQKSNYIPKIAIVTVDIENLEKTAEILIKQGVKKVLIEKPGGLYQREINKLASLSKKNNCLAFVGYNRRFYQSVFKAQEQILADGGVRSFNFEFTEWSHQIAKLNKTPKVKSQWFLANSSHVIDLAFYLGGKPQKISSFVEGSLPWHKNGSVFSGAGEASNGTLFSYKANWEAPGRWGIELLTKKHKLILQPLEELWIQKIGELNPHKVKIAGRVDKDFKPGLFEETKAFLSQQKSNSLLTIGEHQQQVRKIFSKIINSSL